MTRKPRFYEMFVNTQVKEEVKLKRLAFFETLNEVFIENGGEHFHVGCGDINIRVHGRLRGEEDVIGPWVYGRGRHFVRDLKTGEREQRNMLIASLKTTEHVYANTFFQKPDHKKVTRADWNNKGHPYTPDRYAEIDAVMPNGRARNIVKDVESDTDLFSHWTTFR